MAVSGIYKITNPNGKIYIGQSSNINRRMIEHKYRSKTKNLKLYSSIRKYGFDNHKIEILFLSDNAYQKNKMESIFIRFYDSINSGLNHMDTFTYIGGFTNKKHTAENVQKIKDRMSGVKPTWAIEKTKVKVYSKSLDKTFDSTKECAQYFNVSQSLISMMINGKRENKYNLTKIWKRY